MDEDRQASEQSAEPADTPQVQKPEPISTPPAQPATEKQLEKVEREMNSFERSTMRWTKATFVVFAGTMVFVALQWIAIRGQLAEMKSGGKDTHDLAAAAKSQSENTATLAKAAVDQVAQLKAGVTETHTFAKASQDSLAVNRDALHVCAKSLRILRPEYAG